MSQVHMIVNVGGTMLTTDSWCQLPRHMRFRVRAHETEPDRVTCPACLELMAKHVEAILNPNIPTVRVLDAVTRGDLEEAKYLADFAIWD